MQRECKIRVSDEGETVMISLQGDLTASSEKAMEQAYEKACSYGPKSILLKFDGKSRINSAGIALVINLVIESQDKDCRIFITGVSQHFRKIFELVGLTRYTTLIDSADEVLES